MALGHWLHFSAHEIAVWFNYFQCEFSTKSDRKGKTTGVCFKDALEMETCSTCATVCWASKIQLMSPLILRLTASYHIYCNLSSDRALLAKQTALETVGMEWNFPLTTSLAL